MGPNLEARELERLETWRAVPALLELRPGSGHDETLAERVDSQRSAGYRLLGSFEQDDEHAATVAGFRIGESLAWGRFLYVDDLVTRRALRGRGHATAVMRWLEDESVRAHCGQLHLDSGVGIDRAHAHRLYFRQGLVIASHHFAKKVG